MNIRQEIADTAVHLHNQEGYEPVYFGRERKTLPRFFTELYWLEESFRVKTRDSEYIEIPPTIECIATIGLIYAPLKKRVEVRFSQDPQDHPIEILLDDSKFSSNDKQFDHGKIEIDEQGEVVTIKTSGDIEYTAHSEKAATRIRLGELTILIPTPEDLLSRTKLNRFPVEILACEVIAK